MSWLCARCGSPNHGPSCATCGSPQAGGGWGQPQAPPAQWGAGPPPGPAPPGGAWGAPAGAPPAMPQQPRRKSGGGGKLIGCGLAGCFGVIIAIGLILGVVFVVADSASSSTPSGASPKSGPLRDIIPKKVGKWKATGSKPLQVEGAVDSLLVKYRAGSSTLEYAVAIFPSDSMAKGALEGASDVVRRDTGETGEPIRIKDPGGKVIGTGYHFRTNPEIICYEIGKLMAVTSGPPGEVADFVAKL